jgi:2-polyprenyl-3-methyl-5-hydroxy-6-metoxy-1,4-benzoquinol methylase
MPVMNSYQYDGDELDIFKHAVNWKQYWASFVEEYVQGDVLEVGAGIGANTFQLLNSRQTRWVCLEPDRELAARLEILLKSSERSSSCHVISGTLETLSPESLFDVIMHIDVLEHIQDDREELTRAAKHLKPNGRLIVLSPAHMWLFSRFDREIGHHRRYNKRTLINLIPEYLKLEHLLYLDCVGLLASLANRLLLRQSLPSLKQIKFWDRTMIPFSRRLDGCFFYHVGKSILGVWRKG